MRVVKLIAVLLGHLAVEKVLPGGIGLQRKQKYLKRYMMAMMIAVGGLVALGGSVSAVGQSPRRIKLFLFSNN